MSNTFLTVKLVLSAVLFISYIQILEVSADDGYGGYGSAPLSAVKSPLIAQVRGMLLGVPINPLWTTDRNIARMIIDTGYRVDRAIRRLKRTAAFRGKIKADSLLTWTPSERFTSNLPYECTGSANDGSPVFLFPFGAWDTPRFFNLGGRSSEFYTYFMRMLEDARTRTEGRVNPITGLPVDQAVFIVDAKGFGLRKLLNVRATWTFMRIAYAIDRHYPFLVQKWYVVNAPVTFQIFWRFIRFVSSPTLERAVEIYSTIATGLTKRGINALAHNIRKEAIPVKLGGTYTPKYEAAFAAAKAAHAADAAKVPKKSLVPAPPPEAPPAADPPKYGPPQSPPSIPSAPSGGYGGYGGYSG